MNKIFFIITIFLFNTHLLADDLILNLDDLYETNLVTRLQKEGNTSSNQGFLSESWLPSEKEFSRIFKTPTILNSWMGDPSEKFKVTFNKCENFLKFVSCKRVFQTREMVKNKENINLYILIPHPKYAAMASNKLVKVFKLIRDPEYKIKETNSTGEINNISYEEYLDGDQIYSYFKMPKHSIFRMDSTLKNKDLLYEVVSLIHFDKLKEKINS